MAFCPPISAFYFPLSAFVLGPKEKAEIDPSFLLSTFRFLLLSFLLT
jgi:hypothetical protein